MVTRQAKHKSLWNLTEMSYFFKIDNGDTNVANKLALLIWRDNCLSEDGDYIGVTCRGQSFDTWLWKRREKKHGVEEFFHTDTCDVRMCVQKAGYAMLFSI